MNGTYWCYIFFPFKFDDTCQSNVIDSNTNEDNIEDVVIQMRSELDNLEAEFHAYSDSYDRSIEFMRDILDGDGAESAPYDDEEVLVGTTRHYSYTQHNNVTQIILHDEDWENKQSSYHFVLGIIN